MRSFFRDRLMTVDTRTLGLFRVFFGLLMLTNLWDRMGGLDGVSFYTNEGVWPNHFALYLPPVGHFWSPLLGFSTRFEMRAYMVVIGFVYLCYTLGWRTRLMQVLALVCVEAVNLRFLLIQHGGNVVMNIIAVWTVFLPLGERYSLDALFRSLREVHEKDAAAIAERKWLALRTPAHTGIAYTFILINFAVIYLFNTVHKIGPTWHDGSAVHYVLWQNRLNTALAGWLRFHEPAFFSPLFTWATLIVEGSLVALILSPWRWKLLRPIASLNIQGLHGSIALLCTLGPFSYGMMCFGLLLITAPVWDWLEQRWKAPRFARVVRFDPASRLHLLGARVAARLDGGQALTFEEARGHRLGPADVAKVMEALPGWRWLSWLPVAPLLGPLAWWCLRSMARIGGELLVPRPPPPRLEAVAQASAYVRFGVPVLIFSAVVSQVLMENWGVPAQLKPRSRPEWMTATIEYLQIPQGWSMFAPDAPMSDHLLVVDAVLADGTHVDPLTGLPPDFDAPLHGPLGYNQHWCEIHSRMPGWRHHWRNFRDYLKRRPELLDWPPEKRIVSLEVWKISSDSPPPGETTPRNIRRERLFGEEPL